MADDEVAALVVDNGSGKREKQIPPEKLKIFDPNIFLFDTKILSCDILIRSNKYALISRINLALCSLQ